MWLLLLHEGGRVGAWEQQVDVASHENGPFIILYINREGELVGRIMMLIGMGPRD